MKQYLQKILLAMTIFLATNTASAYDFEIDGIYYSVLSLEDMTCEVVPGDEKYEGDIVIPQEVTYNTRNLIVKAIGKEAFNKCDNLKTITIPSTVIAIKNMAFSNCSTLVAVNLPDCLTSIGEYAFSSCNNLITIDIPDSVKTIGSECFAECGSLKHISLPSSLNSIPDGIFRKCSSIENVILPDSVKYIRDEAFEGCVSLKDIYIPNSVLKIGYKAFNECTSLEIIKIPNSVKSIGILCFRNCKALRSIMLSDALESIESGLFYNCEMLESLEIPGSVERISQWSDSGYYTFYNCVNLSKLNFQYSKESLAIGRSEIWEVNGFILSQEFKICGWGDWTKTIKFLYLDRDNFTNNSTDASISVPNLEQLEIGENINNVQVKNIDELKSLSVIVSHALYPPILPEMSNSQYMNMKVFVPEESLEAYKANPRWGKFWNLSDVKSVNDTLEKSVVGRYDLSGKTVNEDYKGFVIVRFSDGSTKKIMQ